MSDVFELQFNADSHCFVRLQHRKGGRIRGEGIMGLTRMQAPHLLQSPYGLLMPLHHMKSI